MLQVLANFLQLLSLPAVRMLAPSLSFAMKEANQSRGASMVATIGSGFLLRRSSGLVRPSSILLSPGNVCSASSMTYATYESGRFIGHQTPGFRGNGLCWRLRLHRSSDERTFRGCRPRGSHSLPTI